MEDEGCRAAFYQRRSFRHQFVGAQDRDRHNGKACLSRQMKRPFLEWHQPAVRRARAFRENSHVDVMLHHFARAADAADG